MTDILEYLGNKKILIIEPASNYRNSYKRFFSNLRVVKQIRFVGNIADARREMLTSEVALFISEWKLPEQNGLQFCRELKSDSQFKNIPFLLVSTENLKNDVILAGDIGCDAYLLKPFSFEDFKVQIFNLIEAFANPSKTNVLIQKGYECLDQNDLDSAHQNFLQAFRENQESARALSGLAKVEMLRQNPLNALKYFTKAVTLKPEFIEGYRGLLEAYTGLNDTEGMFETAKTLNKMNPENPSYVLLIAKCLIEKQEFQESEKFFKSAIKLSPKLADAYKGLGHVMFLQEEYDEAMRNFEKALDLDAKDISTINYLGLALVKQDKLDEGISKYRIALRLDPFDTRVLFNLGYAFEKKNSLSQALHFYQQALTYNPEFDKAKRGVERVQQLLGGKNKDRNNPSAA